MTSDAHPPTPVCELLASAWSLERVRTIMLQWSPTNKIADPHTPFQGCGAISVELIAYYLKEDVECSSLLHVTAEDPFTTHDIADLRYVLGYLDHHGPRGPIEGWPQGFVPVADPLTNVSMLDTE